MPSRDSLARLHAGFVGVLPVVEAHARAAFGHLRCPGRAEDAVAEVVGLAWLRYRLLARRKPAPADLGSTLARLAIDRVRSGGRVCDRQPRDYGYQPQVVQ